LMYGSATSSNMELFLLVLSCSVLLLESLVQPTLGRQLCHKELSYLDSFNDEAPLHANRDVLYSLILPDVGNGDEFVSITEIVYSASAGEGNVTAFGFIETPQGGRFGVDIPMSSRAARKDLKLQGRSYSNLKRSRVNLEGLGQIDAIEILRVQSGQVKGRDEKFFKRNQNITIEVRYDVMSDDCDRMGMQMVRQLKYLSLVTVEEGLGFYDVPTTIATLPDEGYNGIGWVARNSGSTTVDLVWFRGAVQSGEFRWRKYEDGDVRFLLSCMSLVNAQPSKDANWMAPGTIEFGFDANLAAWASVFPDGSDKKYTYHGVDEDFRRCSSRAPVLLFDRKSPTLYADEKSTVFIDPMPLGGGRVE